MSQIGFPALPPGFYRPGPSVGGSIANSPRKTPDKSKDYVSAARPSQPGLPRVLNSWIDEVMRTQGPYIYEAMDLDPACKSAKETLVLSILAGGLDLAPADKPKDGTKDEARTPDQVKAAEYVDEAWRHIERIDDFESVLRDVLEAVKDGARLARPVFEVASNGPDKGNYVLKSFTVKPRDAWDFVVDDFMNVLEIEAKYGPDGQKVRYPAEQFLWLTWDQRGNDPRGQSEYRAAHEPWNLKYLAIPEYYAYLKQFASGKVSATTAPGEVDRDPVDVDGVIIPGAAKITPQQFMVSELANFANGGIHVGPAESKVTVHWPSGDGAPFLKGFDHCDRQIHLAILGTPSATLEAQHDSRAKGATGQDVFGLKVERGRKALSAFVRKLLRLIITLNHGEDDAWLTPLVTFGQTDQQDRAALWSAAASLGFQIGESQIHEFDQMLGLPTRNLEADEAKAKAKADEAFKQQQALNPPAVPGTKAGAPGDAAPPKPKPKPKAKPAQFAADDEVEFAKGMRRAKPVGKTKGGAAAGKLGGCGSGAGGFKVGNTCAAKAGVKAEVVVESGPPRDARESRLLAKAEAAGKTAIVRTETLHRRVEQADGVTKYHLGDEHRQSVAATADLRKTLPPSAAKADYPHIEGSKFVHVDHLNTTKGVHPAEGYKTIERADRAARREIAEEDRGFRPYQREARLVADPDTADLLAGTDLGRHEHSTMTIRVLRRALAEFAAEDYGTALTGPWHDADIRAARGIVGNVFPTGAMLQRWEKGTETPENCRVALSMIVTDAKAKLEADGLELARKLREARGKGKPAEFAEGDDPEPDEATVESPPEPEDEGVDWALLWLLVSAWFETTAVYLRRVHLAGTYTLIGPVDLTADEWQALRTSNQEQLDYLGGFAAALAAGTIPSDSVIAKRAGSYGDAVWHVAQSVQRTHMVGQGMTQERSRLGKSKDSCGPGDKPPGVPSCRQEQAKGWQPIGTLSLPGRRKCKGGCECHLEFRK